MLKQFEEQINLFRDYFVKRYFGKNASDVYWIADEIGGCLAINDYFFSLEDLINFVKYKYSRQEMFDYYDYRLNTYLENETNYKNEIVINIKNWKKLKQ